MSVNYEEPKKSRNKLKTTTKKVRKFNNLDLELQQKYLHFILLYVPLIRQKSSLEIVNRRPETNTYKKLPILSIKNSK